MAVCVSSVFPPHPPHYLQARNHRGRSLEAPRIWCSDVDHRCSFRPITRGRLIGPLRVPCPAHPRPLSRRPLSLAGWLGGTSEPTQHYVITSRLWQPAVPLEPRYAYPPGVTAAVRDPCAPHDAHTAVAAYTPADNERGPGRSCVDSRPVQTWRCPLHGTDIFQGGSMGGTGTRCGVGACLAPRIVCSMTPLHLHSHTNTLPGCSILPAISLTACSVEISRYHCYSRY